jgi:DDE superfamily endonuclease
LRVPWRVMVAATTRPERLVFVDETGINTSLAPLYACSRRGNELALRWCATGARTSPSAGEHEREGDGALPGGRRPDDQGGVRDLPGAGFGAELAPLAGGGDGYLSSHKGPRVRELVEARGCELLYLPAYSPDLNPIEDAFAKLKALLRRTGARTREALLEATGWALEAVTAKDARGFFEHRGYHATAQLL